MIPQRVAAVVESHLGKPISKARSLSGGCIAHATRLEVGRDRYFLKWSDDEAARTFEPEAEGLRALRAADSALRIPKPLLAQPAAESAPGVLLAEWIEHGRESADFWERFGRDLADLHRHTGQAFGFDADNFIGRVPQENSWMEGWMEFFALRRLEPQVRRAKNGGRWKRSWDAPYGRLLSRLDSLLPQSPEPSMLHGDLWSGNFMTAADGTAAVFDPAAYFGHREADLAMTELFGGFHRRFYESYREAWLLDGGYEERRDLYNLYHIINHLNHFGSGYAASVERILRSF